MGSDDCGHDYFVAYWCKGRAAAPRATRGARWRVITQSLQSNIAPARAPPLWEDDCGTQMDEGVHIKPEWDLAAQPAPTLMSISASIGDGLRRRFWPEHQTLVVNPAGGAANRVFHADAGRVHGAILGRMWVEHLSVRFVAWQSVAAA